MDIHENARTTRHSRMLMVQRLIDGWSVSSVAAAHGVSERTVRKWRERFAEAGEGECQMVCVRGPRVLHFAASVR